MQKGWLLLIMKKDVFGGIWMKYACMCVFYLFQWYKATKKVYFMWSFLKWVDLIRSQINCMLVYVFVMYLYVSWDFQVLWGLQEGSQNKDGRARHSAWRNYDDLNEFFWWLELNWSQMFWASFGFCCFHKWSNCCFTRSSDCFRLGWPIVTDNDFFTSPENPMRVQK